MTTGILLLNFGEPASADREAVVAYLSRIFYDNADLEEADEREARRRSRELAERRAPGLMEEYREIGGSPLNRQASEQAEALEEALRNRGHSVLAGVGMQFTEPTIRNAARAMRSSGVDRLVGLPMYPLCGRSTTVAALEDVDEALEEMGWSPPRADLTGWHRHPDYVGFRADNVRDFCEREGVDLSDPGTRLVFSAHGTPRKYLEEGSRYEEYVQEYCRALAADLGVDDPALGYQNHGNRGVPWTEPDVEDVVTALEVDRAVVEPVSFMHEQSETLSELDLELREEAEEAGVRTHRVPVPHAAPRFVRLLADLVEPLLDGTAPDAATAAGDGGRFRYGECRCKPTEGTYCLNAVDQPASSPA